MLTCLLVFAVFFAVQGEVCSTTSITDDLTTLFYDYDAITDTSPPRPVPPTYSAKDIHDLQAYINAIVDYLGAELLTPAQEQQIQAEVDRRWNAITAQNPTGTIERHALSLCVDVKVKAAQDLFTAKADAATLINDQAYNAFRIYDTASRTIIDEIQEQVDKGDIVAVQVQAVAIALLRQSQRLQDVQVYLFYQDQQLLDEIQHATLAVKDYYDRLERNLTLIDAAVAVEAGVIETIRYRIAFRRGQALVVSIQEDWPKIVQALKDNLQKLQDDLFAAWTDAVNRIKTYVENNEAMVRREIADALAGRRCNVTDTTFSVTTNANNQIVVSFNGIHCDHPDHTAVEQQGFACNALKAYLSGTVTVTTLDHYTCVAGGAKKRADTTFNAVVTGNPDQSSSSALLAGLFVLLLSSLFHI